MMHRSALYTPIFASAATANSSCPMPNVADANACHVVVGFPRVLAGPGRGAGAVAAVFGDAVVRGAGVWSSLPALCR